MARLTRRLWTDEEKRSICIQTVAPGVSVAQVARRHAVNANPIFKWLRDPRYTPNTAAAASTPEGSRFLPVDIIDAKPASDTPVAQNRINIELSGVHRMQVTSTSGSRYIRQSTQLRPMVWPEPTAEAHQSPIITWPETVSLCTYWTSSSPADRKKGYPELDAACASC